MYHHIKGEIKVKTLNRLVVETHGVGFDILVSSSSGESFPQVGQEAFVLIHPVFRENESTLYGFSSEEERAVFRQLLRVSGVGPSVALQILSQSSLQQLVSAIVTSDIAFLTKMKGLGKKTAERLIVELRDRLKGVESSSGIKDARWPEDAFQALLVLGIGPERARMRLEKVHASGSPPAETSEWIRLALQSGQG